MSGPHRDFDSLEGSAGQRDLAKLQVERRRIESPSHPLSHELLAYWAARSCDGRLLRRDEAPGRALAKLMPYLFLMAPVNPEGTDWRYRLTSSAAVERFGGSIPKGMTLTERFRPDLAANRIEAYNEIVRTKQPLIERGRRLGIDRDFCEIEVVHLPILAADGKACWVFGGMFFFS